MRAGRQNGERRVQCPCVHATVRFRRRHRTCLSFPRVASHFWCTVLSSRSRRTGMVRIGRLASAWIFFPFLPILRAYKLSFLSWIYHCRAHRQVTRSSLLAAHFHEPREIGCYCQFWYVTLARKTIIPSFNFGTLFMGISWLYLLSLNFCTLPTVSCYLPLFQPNINKRISWKISMKPI